MRDGSYSEEEAFELLHQFEHILESDPLIDEIGFIHPSQFVLLKEEEAGALHTSHNGELQAKDGVIRTNENTSFWSRDHKLGISTEVLLPLYKAAKRAFMSALEEYRKCSNLDKECVNGSISCATLSSYLDLEIGVMKHSRAVLLLSCDFGTAWNARKLILLKKQDLSIFMDELLLSGLVLSLSPKSEQAWSYRRWIIKMIAAKFPPLQDIVAKESELVESIAERSKMNYRAWNHRCWLVSHMTIQQALHELKKSKNWAGLHVADSSCFHYRRRLLLKILESTEAYQVWKEELDWNKELIKRYVGREALWLHRRFLSLCWVRHFTNYLRDATCQKGENTQINDEIAFFVDNEMSLLNSCSSVPDQEFEDFQAQALYAATYIAWLTKQIPEWRRVLQEKLGAEDLKGTLKMAGSHRSGLWDHLVNFSDTS